MTTATKEDPDLLRVAERLFDAGGFAATGMDKIIAAAGISSRTFYKRTGSKRDLIAALLRQRDRLYWERSQASSLDELFDALRAWFASESARGCLFLRASSEGLDKEPEIAAAIAEHKTRLVGEVERLVRLETGSDDLVVPVLLLYEGAVAAASYRGPGVIEDAKRAVALMVGRS